jgi:putative chitinase
MIKDFLKAYFNSNSDVSSRRVNVLLFILFFMAISCIGMFTVWVKNMTVFNVVIDAVLWIIVAGIFGVSATDIFNKRKHPQPQPEPAPAPEPQPEPKPEPAPAPKVQIKAPLPTAAQRFLPWLEIEMAKAEINTPLRMAHFLSQLHHESGGFRFVKEIWGPTPAQRRYEGRADLGNTETGDGKKFMGRGLIQVTGRHNYAACSQHLFGNSKLLTTPELLETPQHAVQSAVWFWTKNDLNTMADAGSSYAHCVAVTKRINGGTNGIKDRWAQFTKIYQQLNA